MKYIEKFNIDNEEFQIVPPVATEQQLGGIKTKAKETEDVPVAVDENGQAFVPPYPDGSGKVDIAQGVDNANKVMVVDETGNLVPTEFKGGSDNKLIGTVAKSENPSVSDSYNTEFMNLNFYGKSTQLTTTGGNKLGIDNFYTRDNVKIIPQNGELTFTTLYFIKTDFSFGVGTYYFTRKFENSTLNASNNISIRDSSETIVSTDIASYTRKDDYTFEIQIKDASNPLFLYVNTIDNVQLTIYDIGVFKEYPFTYEPYTGGQPSPSQEYQQDITKIEQVSDKIIWKNWFDMSTFVKENFVYSHSNGQKCILVKLLPNMQYTISRYGTGGYQSGHYLFIYNDINFPTIGQIINSNTQTNKQKITFTTLETGYLYIGVNTTKTLQTVLDIIKYIQVELGSTATEYEPYTEQPFSFTPPQPLYSTPDGSIADVVNVESGQYEYNMSGAVVFDGSDDEAWLTNDNGFFIKIANMITTYNSANFWCNKYIVKVSLDKGNVYINAGFMYFQIDKNEITSVEQWKQYLQSNPITVVYPLATPTTQPIPTETLEQLRALQSYIGVTNFLCNAPVSFDYEQSVNIVIKNILNSIAQTNANLLLNTSKEG